jgi:hypothetical protein
LEQLDEDGGCRRQCLQVMRQLKEDVWCPGKRPVITSYHLQVRGAAGRGPRAVVGPIASVGWVRAPQKRLVCV